MNEIKKLKKKKNELSLYEILLGCIYTTYTNNTDLNCNELYSKRKNDYK